MQRPDLELRERARILVERHWSEIVAVGEELLRVQTLDDSEVEILADLAAGDPDVTAADLALYRWLRTAARAEE